MNRVVLIRHAHAGDRARWSGPDAARPLSEKGLRQSRALIQALGALAFDHVASSSSLRCVQTVEPLAGARHLTVAEDDRLVEGHDPEDTLAWLEENVRAGSLAACTHGDLVPALLDMVEVRGVMLPADRRWPKASAWVLEAEGGRWTAARYIEPPAV